MRTFSFCKRNLPRVDSPTADSPVAARYPSTLYSNRPAGREKGIFPVGRAPQAALRPSFPSPAGAQPAHAGRSPAAVPPTAASPPSASLGGRRRSCRRLARAGRAAPPAVFSVAPGPNSCSAVNLGSAGCFLRGGRTDSRRSAWLRRRRGAAVRRAEQFGGLGRRRLRRGWRVAGASGLAAQLPPPALRRLLGVGDDLVRLFLRTPPSSPNSAASTNVRSS